MFYHLKHPMQSEVTLTLKYRILPINHKLFVFHLKSEGLLKVLPQMKIKTEGVSMEFHGMS